MSYQIVQTQSLHSPGQPNAFTQDVGQKHKWTPKAKKKNRWKHSPARTIRLHSRCKSWLKEFPKPKAANNWESTPKDHIASCLYPGLAVGCFFMLQTKAEFLSLTQHSCLEHVCYSPAGRFYESLHKCSLLGLAQIHFSSSFTFESILAFKENPDFLVFLNNNEMNLWELLERLSWANGTWSQRCLPIQDKKCCSI